MDTLNKRIFLAPFNILYKISPKSELKLMFKIKQGYKLNLKNPTTYNEKLQWIKLNEKNPLMPKCVDKYTVREYVESKGCKKILNELLWEGFNPEEIPFDELPDKFVIKVTHGSTFNIICTDKDKLDIQDTIKKCKKWLKNKFLPCYGEWFYGIEKPRVIVEKYLDDGHNGDLYDYKVFCFNGKAKLIDVHCGRFGEHKRNIYDLDWNLLKDVRFKYNNFENMEKPKELKELIKYAEILSKDFLHARVDFYIINGLVIFGEITFTNGAGFDKIKPFEFDKEMGSWLNLTTIKKNQNKKSSGLKNLYFKHIKKKFVNNYKKLISFTYFIKSKKLFGSYKIKDTKFKKNTKKYWKKFNLKTNLNELSFYSEINNNKSPKYITKKIYHSIIEPGLNNIIYAEAFSDKNYLERFLKEANLPITIIRKINGSLLNNNYELISKDEAYSLILKEKDDMFFKPSIESCGGAGIIFFDKSINKKNFFEMIELNNFIIQRKIKQHPDLAKFNSSSINTVRVLSLLFSNEVRILYMVLRVGQKGMMLDNASAGGIQIVVKNDGYFSDYITTIDHNKTDDVIHERFKNKKMPFYSEIVTEVKKLHPKLAVCRLIGWDITVDDTCKPVIIETNLLDIGMTDKSQRVNGPLFGDLTDDVLTEALKNNNI